MTVTTNGLGISLPGLPLVSLAAGLPGGIDLRPVRQEQCCFIRYIRFSEISGFPTNRIADSQLHPAKDTGATTPGARWSDQKWTGQARARLSEQPRLSARIRSMAKQFNSHPQQSITCFPVEPCLRKRDNNHIFLRVPPCGRPADPNPTNLPGLKRLHTDSQAISHPGPPAVKHRKRGATQLIGGHHRYGALFEDANPIQNAAVRQHRDKAIVVRHGGHQPSTSCGYHIWAYKRTRGNFIHDHEPTLIGITIEGAESCKLFWWDKEAGINHTQGSKQALM